MAERPQLKRDSLGSTLNLFSRLVSGWTDLPGWERQRTGADCAVCRSEPDAIARLETSWVLVSPDDPMRGYVCLVVGRHAVELHDLTEAEGAGFMRDVRRVSAAVAAIVQPVKMDTRFMVTRPRTFMFISSHAMWATCLKEGRSILV